MENPSKPVSILQHHECEDLGLTADALQRAGVRQHCIRPCEGNLVPREIDNDASLHGRPSNSTRICSCHNRGRSGSRSLHGTWHPSSVWTLIASLAKNIPRAAGATKPRSGTTPGKIISIFTCRLSRHNVVSLLRNSTDLRREKIEEFLRMPISIKGVWNLFSGDFGTLRTKTVKESVALDDESQPNGAHEQKYSKSEDFVRTYVASTSYRPFGTSRPSFSSTAFMSSHTSFFAGGLRSK